MTLNELSPLLLSALLEGPVEVTFFSVNSEVPGDSVVDEVIIEDRDNTLPTALVAGFTNQGGLPSHVRFKFAAPEDPVPAFRPAKN